MLTCESVGTEQPPCSLRMRTDLITARFKSKVFHQKKIFLFIHSFTRSFIYLFVCPHPHSLAHPFDSFIYSFIHSHLFIYSLHLLSQSLGYLFICLFVHSFTHSYVRSLICSLIHVVIHSFIHSHPFNQSFTQSFSLLLDLFIHSIIYS